MVVGLDLKPLTEETITQMGYNDHDLWLVRIGSISFGPYETESLKHYVGDNEHLFENAEATRSDKIEYQPFWQHAVFQRRKMQALSVQNHEGPFWLLDVGLKIGPYNFQEIDKKIEMGLLGMTDHISIDDGHTWNKIFEIDGLDRRTHELPSSPHESEFLKARLALVEKMEQPRIHTSDELATLAYSAQHLAKVIQFKADEMTLHHQNNLEVSPSIRWAIPSAATFLLVIMATGFFMFDADEEPILAVDDPAEESQVKKTARVKPPRGSISGADRTPASVNYAQPAAPSYTQTSRFPTHIETHDEHVEELPQERDPLDGPVTDAEQPVEEHSLVGNQENAPEQSLDAAMNGVNQPVEQPVVEEASDF